MNVLCSCIRQVVSQVLMQLIKKTYWLSSLYCYLKNGHCLKNPSDCYWLVIGRFHPKVTASYSTPKIISNAKNYCWLLKTSEVYVYLLNTNWEIVSITPPLWTTVIYPRPLPLSLLKAAINHFPFPLSLPKALTLSPCQCIQKSSIV